MEKDFDKWSELKKRLDSKKNIPAFKQREIWWCHLGINIGDEENGKNHVHSRPILILKKFNNHIFWGLPLTTQVKEKPYYHKIEFKDNQQCVMISQLRLWDVRRLTTRIGKLTSQQFDEIKRRIGDIVLG
ncbi:MAG: mRNA interferase MazF [Rickettsiales bacterium]|jgi:mRNA interferase MazF